MTPPKRIRLLSACRDHLYNEVKRTLATDKEIRTLWQLDKRVSDYYVSLVNKPVFVKCSGGCGFSDRFVRGEFGVNYFQAIGECPLCNAPTVYNDGTMTKVEIIFTMKEASNG
jgi:hypothetical protein